MLMMATERRDEQSISGARIPPAVNQCFNRKTAIGRQSETILAAEVIQLLAEALLEIEQRRDEQQRRDENDDRIRPIDS